MATGQWKRAAAWGALGVALVVTGGLAWLSVAPPDLLRVGTAYAAKIVCSNVNVAGRDAEEVMAVDVQAPGHPLLKLVHARVDPKTGATRVAFPFGIAASTAAPRGELGCASVDRPDRGGAPTIPPIEPSALPVAIDPRVQALVDDDALLGEGFRAVLVLHEGRIVAERYAEGFDATTPLIGWSMTKTVTAALIGTAIERGLLELDDAALFDAWADDPRAAITVADVMAMESGLAWDEGYGGVSDVTRMLFLERDGAGFVASRAGTAGPGERWTYSTGASVLLARVLAGAVGGGAEALLYPYRALLAPLGMAGAVFESDASGTPSGGSFVYAPARDWARFARFLLDDGVAPNGERLLPEGYVDYMMAPTALSDGDYARGSMWRRGPFGYDRSDRSAEADLPEDAAWMLGHDGQSIALVPSLDLAVLRLGLTPVWANYRPQNLLRETVRTLGE